MDADVPVPSPFQEMRVEEIICPRGEMSPHVMTWQTIRLFLVPVKMSCLQQWASPVPLYALHPDNSLVEYVEWSDETKRKIFGEH